jgi:hypothetical protein
MKTAGNRGGADRIAGLETKEARAAAGAARVRRAQEKEKFT